MALPFKITITFGETVEDLLQWFADYIDPFHARNEWKPFNIGRINREWQIRSNNVDTGHISMKEALKQMKQKIIRDESLKIKKPL